MHHLSGYPVTDKVRTRSCNPRRKVPSVTNGPCPACGNARMRLLSTPRPEYVEQCSSCGSAFFYFGYFGAAEAVSHMDQYNVDADYQGYLKSLNEPSLTQRHRETIAQLAGMLSDVERPNVFDVGAGGGSFLAAAQESGFRIAGNEISQPAIDACRDRYGIELALGDDLTALAAKSSDHDAVTMWCIIAHVDDPAELLRGVRALLKPDGVLFFCTPRYCAIDRGALLLRRVTRDRYRQVFDRRINQHHRRQYSQRGIEALLRREGFTPMSVDPVTAYGLHMEAYLTSIGLPSFISRPVGKALEWLATKGLLPRNTLNVYARAVKD
jgi:SAM-dependent methyltransferase